MKYRIICTRAYVDGCYENIPDMDAEYIEKRTTEFAGKYAYIDGIEGDGETGPIEPEMCVCVSENPESWWLKTFSDYKEAKEYMDRLYEIDTNNLLEAKADDDWCFMRDYAITVEE